jgi:hypothetical protein
VIARYDASVPTFGLVRPQETNLLKFFDADNGQLLWHKKMNVAHCSLFAYAPDSLSFAVSNGDGDSVTIIEVVSGDERCVLKTPAVALGYSADGRFLALGSLEGTIVVLRLRDRKEVATFDAGKTRIRSLTFSSDAGSLFSVCGDGSVLVWDTREQVQKARETVRVPEENLKTFWDDLEEYDTVKAYQVVAALIDSPKQAVPFFQESLRPLLEKEVPAVKKFLADLDSDDADKRKEAYTELKKRGTRMRCALVDTLEGKPSAQVRKSVTELLTRLEARKYVVTPEAMREVRIVEVLEALATPEARALLEACAKGGVGKRLPIEAAAALERLGK